MVSREYLRILLNYKEHNLLEGEYINTPCWSNSDYTVSKEFLETDPEKYEENSKNWLGGSP